ncbi:MAG: rhodanese-like domain-containing protein [Mycobacteriaceae bacterium]
MSISTSPAVPSVIAKELPTKLPNSAVILDVREYQEWDGGHIAQALHIPMGEIPVRMSEIDPTLDVYVMCHSGARSLRVADYLNHNGYKCINVSDGMLGWVQAQRPVIIGEQASGPEGDE